MIETKVQSREDLIKVISLRKNKLNPLKETFGIFKFKKSIKDILSESDNF